MAPEVHVARVRGTLEAIEDEARLITTDLDVLISDLKSAGPRADARRISDRVFRLADEALRARTELVQLDERLRKSPTESVLSVSSDESGAAPVREAVATRLDRLEHAQDQLLRALEQTVDIVKRMPPTTDPLNAAARVEIARRHTVARTVAAAYGAGFPPAPIQALLDEAEALAFGPAPSLSAAGGAGAGAGAGAVAGGKRLAAAPPTEDDDGAAAVTSKPKRGKAKSVDLCLRCDDVCPGYMICMCTCHWCTLCYLDCQDADVCKHESVPGIKCICHGTHPAPPE
jgi:hypothetical protein